VNPRQEWHQHGQGSYTMEGAKEAAQPPGREVHQVESRRVEKREELPDAEV